MSARLDIRLEDLGPRHPAAAMSYSNMCSVYWGHGRDNLVCGYAKYEGIQMKGVLQKLSARIPSSPPHSPEFEWASTTSNPTTAVSVHQMPEPILHEYLWKRLSSWFQPNDIIITENGTANIGIWDSKFPPGVQAINQTLWGSIGYSVGAAQGAALALKDARSESRTILFVGDGNLPISGYKLRSSR